MKWRKCIRVKKWSVKISVTKISFWQQTKDESEKLRLVGNMADTTQQRKCYTEQSGCCD